MHVAGDQFSTELEVYAHHGGDQTVEDSSLPSMAVSIEGSRSGILALTEPSPNIETRAPFDVDFEVIPYLCRFVLYI